MPVIGPVMIDDIGQLTLQTDSGELQMTLPTSQAGLEVQFRLSPAATRGLYELLVQMQQALETDIEGAPPTGARH